MPESETLHQFVLYVENQPGVLNRVASLFRRRAYNIESLAVGHTERPGISRMTIVAGISEGAAQRVEANLYKLVNVLSVEDVTHISTIARSLALIKVEAHEESRHRLMEIVRVFRARVVDLAPNSLDHRDHRHGRENSRAGRCPAPIRHSRDGAHRPSCNDARRETPARPARFEPKRRFGRFGSFALRLIGAISIAALKAETQRSR